MANWSFVAVLVLLALQGRAVMSDLEICDDSVVQVTSIQILCDSPYTFYYGNGANRKSTACDYGDKATITVTFDVSDDLEEDVAIYMMMKAYTDDEQLYYVKPYNLCENYVGSACTTAGSYSFTTKVQFSYLDGSSSKFVPFLEMAFSTTTDSGYNLGGANIDCDGVYDEDTYSSWVSENSNYDTYSQPMASFASNYGIFIGTVTLVSIFALLLWQQTDDDQVQQRRPASSRTVELI